MRKIEPTIIAHDVEGNKIPCWICPRFGETMYEKNIPPDRKCPNGKRPYNRFSCKEGCYYDPYIPEHLKEMMKDRKHKKSLKPKSKRCSCKK
jgi:hypothetical protein